MSDEWAFRLAAKCLRRASERARDLAVANGALALFCYAFGYAFSSAERAGAARAKVARRPLKTKRPYAYE